MGWRDRGVQHRGWKDTAWKEMVNAGLRRTTGYHLTKAPDGEVPDRAPAADIRPQLARVRKQAEQANAEARDLRRQLVRARRARGFPSDYDSDIRDIIEQVRAYTMTGNDKLHALISATRYITRHAIPGEIVECGVWRGGSMQAVALTLLALGETGRELYLFDTFEGMPPPTDKDVRVDGRTAAEMLAATDRGDEVWAVATLDDVRSGFTSVPYPADKIHFIQGRVENTVPAQVPEQIAILRLDTDWYESTDHELRTMYDRLSSGGVLMIDDYGHWEGSRRATDEFLERTGERLLLIRMGGGRVAVKP